MLWMHLASPRRGAGLSQDIKDAMILGFVLEKAERIRELHAVCKAYDEVYPPRASRTVA